MGDRASLLAKNVELVAQHKAVRRSILALVRAAKTAVCVLDMSDPGYMNVMMASKRLWATVRAVERKFKLKESR